jgi:hypothetical protein
MRVRLLAEVAAAGVLCCFAAAAGEPGAPRPEGEAIEDALAEPADPDDQANVRADNDPNDVGQEALAPSEILLPGPEQPTPTDATDPDEDPGGD